MRQLFPCDAVALLRLDGEVLVPLAVEGLSPDTLGRRFRVSEHPRLAALLEHAGPTRFAADCGLPDPYDGLVEGLHGHRKCMTALAARCTWTNSSGGC